MGGQCPLDTPSMLAILGHSQQLWAKPSHHIWGVKLGLCRYCNCSALLLATPPSFGRKISTYIQRSRGNALCNTCCDQQVQSGRCRSPGVLSYPVKAMLAKDDAPLQSAVRSTVYLAVLGLKNLLQFLTNCRLSAHDQRPGPCLSYELTALSQLAHSAAYCSHHSPDIDLNKVSGHTHSFGLAFLCISADVSCCSAAYLSCIRL